MADFEFGIRLNVSKAAEVGEALSLAEANIVMQGMLDAGEPMRFTGVASSTALDKDDEWMTDECIKGMAAQAPVDLVPAPERGRHWDVSVGRELGVAKSFDVATEDGRLKLRVEGELNPAVEQSRAIFVSSLAGESYDLSVMGPVTSGWGKHPVTGKAGKFFSDLRFDHIAVARAGRGINPDSWMAAVSKASAETALEDAVRDTTAGQGAEAMPKTAKSYMDDMIPVDHVQTAEGDFEAVVPVVQVETLEDSPPSAVFVDNAPQTTGVQRYHDVIWEFDPFIDQLRITLRGITALETPEERTSAFATALSDFGAAAAEGVSEAISKAGARHSKTDIKNIHAALDALMTVCGCEPCATAIAAAAEAVKESEEAASKAANKEAAQAAEGDIDMDAKEVATLLEGAVSKAVDPINERLAAIETKLNEKPEPEVAKAEETPEADAGKPADAASKAGDDPETADDPKPDAEKPKEVAAKADDPDEKDAEIERLKTELAESVSKADELAAKPEAGGPAAAAADEGDERLTSKGEGEEDLVKVAIAEGDHDTAKRVVAARVTGHKV